jgi:dienelactone hydrolase
MAEIVLFHSALGLRDVEQMAAERIRSAGHHVVTPDLYAGKTASSVDQGLEFMAEVGWQTICGRAREALASIPDTAVMIGLSMGAGVISEVWPERDASQGVVVLHALAAIPANLRSRFPLAVHVADPDVFAMPDHVAAWRNRAALAKSDAEIFTYPNVGHFFTDEALPEYDSTASELAWSRVLAFLQKRLQ